MYLFRMGAVETFSNDPAQRRPFARQRFPIYSFDQLCAQLVRRWTTNADASAAAYADLVSRFERVVTVAHSQGRLVRSTRSCPNALLAREPEPERKVAAQ